jgi:YidC/Oxa1 family membrane protein insertase
MPERIGYLKNLGLDYGWGPTAMMEWTLEHVHVYAGSPWWLSIILTTVLVRVIMFKGYMMASDNAARMAVVRPLTLPLTKEMTAAQLTKDHEKVFELRREIQAMNSRAGVKIWRGFVPMLQVFTGYGLWVCLRGMSKLPVPGLETGGILWFQNLTVPDPFFLLPAVTSLVLHWVLRVCIEEPHS